MWERLHTTDSYTITRNLQGFQAKQLPLVATFKDYIITAKIVSAIRVLYDESKGSVLVDGHLSEGFEVTTGVRPVDIFTPFLFIIVLDYVACQATINNANIGLWTRLKRSTRHSAKCVNDLDFADDICLPDVSIVKAQV